MDLTTRLLTMGASGSGSAPTYVEDVFSTWLYTGNGSTQTITNGIDLSGKGGLVWTKCRSAVSVNFLADTARGISYRLMSDATSAQSLITDAITSVTSSGYTLGADGNGQVNFNAATYASWTFRKAAKFFDVVSYTGSGANRTIAHSLGSVPGTIIVKRTDTTGDWQVYHLSLANTEYMVLNSTAAKATGTTRWNSTTPTSTEFSLGTDATVNASGGTYVAYLFAHDAGGFGDSGNDSVVSCGSYTGNGSTTGPTIDLGWEPQWLLIKSSTFGSSWGIVDNMRGIPVGGGVARLLANTSDAETTTSTVAIDPLPTGFQIKTIASIFNQPNQTYIYVAIRRGPMKTPTDATKVFAVNNVSPSSGSSFTTNFPVDMTINTYRPGSITQYVQNRLVGYPLTGTTTGTEGVLVTRTTWAESAVSGAILYAGDSNTSIKYSSNIAGSTNTTHAFRRAPGFFDAVAYTGTGSATTISHNLGVAPELMIVKRRNTAGFDWRVYTAATGAGNMLTLNTTAASTADTDRWNNTAPTASVFSVGTSVGDTNVSGGTYIAYLFATCPGVSKVGSYTGSGTTKQIDCGFTAGARFVLIKRTDSTGDWYVWDTARGIVSGNDPYFLLNSDVAQVTNTDYIDPLNSGFEISSTAPAAINANGGSFIYLAIA